MLDRAMLFRIRGIGNLDDELWIEFKQEFASLQDRTVEWKDAFDFIAGLILSYDKKVILKSAAPSTSPTDKSGDGSEESPSGVPEGEVGEPEAEHEAVGEVSLPGRTKDGALNREDW